MPTRHLQRPRANDALAVDATVLATPREEAHVSGVKLTIAILAWILASLAIAALTLGAARAVAPAWAANTNETATVVGAEG